MRLTTVGAAALIAMSSLLTTTAYAADLGGNCCADLEERVAELEATTARKGNRKMSLEVSGHINAAVFTTDIDGLDDAQIIDNSNAQSRFRFRGTATINTEWSAGFLMEFGSSGINLDGTPSVRHQALFLRSKQLGTVWLGRTSSSTDGVMEISLAPSVPVTLGSLAPFDAVVEDATGLGLNNPFDGGRTNLVRYISPELGGFSFSAAWMEADNYDLALRYAGEWGAFRVAAGIGYRYEELSADFILGPSDGDREFVGGSASAIHMPSGLFADFQYGRSNGLQTIDVNLNKVIPFIWVWPEFSVGADARMDLYGFRGGISKTFSSLGKTTIAGYYNRLEIDGTSVDLDVYGLSINQEIDAAAMDIYAAWTHYDLGVGGSETANTFIVGSRVRF